jgi:signal transduction histidine kinase
MVEDGIDLNMQRLRYEAFSNFATALNKCMSFEDICGVLSSQVKFILHSFVFRVNYRYQSCHCVFQVYMGKCDMYLNEDDATYLIEKQIIKRAIPVIFDKTQMHDDPVFADTIYLHAKINRMFALPIVHNADHHILVTVASKETSHHVELDFKFLKLISELISNKIYQLLLIENIAAKNEELLVKNEHIERLNKNLSKIVNQRTHELTEANEELTSFFYRTSHDFRTPLTNIMGLANLATVMTEDTDILDLFDQCKKVAHGMDNMLAKLHTLTESRDATLQNIDFNALFLKTKTKFSNRLLRCQGSINFHISPNFPDFLSDPDILEVVFENLVDNCINYNKGQLVIDVDLFYKNDNVFIKITDNGQGIDKAVLPKVFDMYYRANAHSPGNGLGLYIVRKLLKVIQGEIFVFSTLGEYTSFTIKLSV